MNEFFSFQLNAEQRLLLMSLSQATGRSMDALLTQALQLLKKALEAEDDLLQS